MNVICKLSGPSQKKVLSFDSDKFFFHVSHGTLLNHDLVEFRGESFSVDGRT